MKPRNSQANYLLLASWIMAFCTIFAIHSVFASTLAPIEKNTTIAKESYPLKKTDLTSHWPFPEKVRGINITYKYLSPSVPETLSKWNANVLRINIGTQENLPADFNLSSPLKGYREAIHRIDNILPYCRKNGIGIILSLSGVPGRQLDYFWKKNGMDFKQGDIGAIWKALAQRYKSEPSIVAYDLFNEPDFDSGNESVWYEGLLPVLLQSIRNIDNKIPLIIEPGPWGLPDGFSNMKIINDPNIIYSFHHYAPHNYTHQGVREKRKNSWGNLTYPGWLQMFNTSFPKKWNKEELKNSMKEARQFQKKNNVRILIGEFGVARWAPGREQWVKDSIEIFEEYGWGWCFHSYSGWNGWNPTFKPTDKLSNVQDGGQVTKTLQVLLHYFKLNKPFTKGNKVKYIDENKKQ